MDRDRLVTRLRWVGALFVLACSMWVGGANWPHP